MTPMLLLLLINLIIKENPYSYTKGCYFPCTGMQNIIAVLHITYLENIWGLTEVIANRPKPWYYHLHVSQME